MGQKTIMGCTFDFSNFEKNTCFNFIKMEKLGFLDFWVSFWYRGVSGVIGGVAGAYRGRIGGVSGVYRGRIGGYRASEWIFFNLAISVDFLMLGRLEVWKS